jgi:hypothetical protein
MHFTREFGGRERVRTADPLLAKQVLSQLSYTPIEIGLLEYCNFFILRSFTFNCN